MKKLFCTVFVWCCFLFFSARTILAEGTVVIDSAPEEAAVMEEFYLEATGSGFKGGTSYYYKARIGKETAEMNQAQTYNESSDSWLNDTDSWATFPVVLTETDGSFSYN